MSKIIRIDDDLWEVLKSKAEPLVDTPSSVIRRIFEEHGYLTKVEVKKADKPKRERRKNG